MGWVGEFHTPLGLLVQGQRRSAPGLWKEFVIPGLIWEWEGRGENGSEWRGCCHVAQTTELPGIGHLH